MKKKSNPREPYRFSILVLLLILFPILIFAFQNCGNAVRFTALSSIISKGGLEFGGGNGEGYGGKPDGHYFHFVPGFSCEGKESPANEIHATASGITHVENIGIQCGANGTPLSETVLDQSRYHGHLLGYRDMIFEKMESAPSAIPDELMEAWCFDDPVQKTLEVIHRYNWRLGTTSLQVLGFTPDGTPAARTESGIARLVEQRSVLYQTQNYELKVNKDNLASTSGQYIGSLKTSIQGRSFELNLSCRLGGYLDARLWPARLLADGNIAQFDVFPSQNRLVTLLRKRSLARTLANQPWEGVLVDLNFTTDVSRALTPLQPAFVGVADFQVKPDRSGLLFRSDQESTARTMYRMAHLDLTSSMVQMISSPLLNAAQKVTPDYHLTSDGWVFYRDGRQEEVGTDIEPWIWSMPLNLGQNPPTYQVNHTLPLNGDYEIRGYFIAEKSKRVVYSAVSLDLKEEWFAANYDGSQNVQISREESSKFYNPYLITKLVDGSPGYLLYSVPVDDTNRLRQNLVAAALDGSGVVDLQIQFAFDLQASPDGSAVYLKQVSSDVGLQLGGVVTLSKSYLVTMGTWRKIEVPVLQAARFSPDSRTLIGTSASGQILSVDVTTGQVQNRCAQRAKIVETSPYFDSQMFALEEASGHWNLLRIQGLSCEVVNRIPVPNNWSSVDPTVPLKSRSLKWDLSPNGQSLLLTSRITRLDLLQSESRLLWIPLDGQPAIRVDAPVGSWGVIDRALFHWDSKSVIYWGPQLDPGAKHLFQWKLPQQ
ncbi:MAG: hypothetical protein NDI61_03170 [Bdellovibrionaceae bacterium]|nr:hypothetical protein [Pseudobdellovibrionaceae bacterium]